jgi:hypothetical protein
LPKPAKFIPSVKINLQEKSEDELISLRIQLDKEFILRKIKFNVGEIGETIAITFFKNQPNLTNLQRAPTGTKSVDALSRDGERYSIKTIKDGSKTGTIYPDPLDKDKQLFEYLLMVQINDNYELKSLHRFSWKQFLNVRKWDKTMNAWYISKSIKAFQNSECIYEK